MASTGRVIEKPSQDQQQQPLRCPRCDSSNTKFCYYNNYSLSQPRHFCKACKRYWTRGGTLRNVPVGGGCRKNKRVKRPAPAIDASSAAPTPTTKASIQPRIDLSSTSNHINPLFYGLPTNPSELSLPYPTFNSSVSNVDTVTGYDLQPQMNAHGLGFSSGPVAGDVQDDDYRNGFNPIKQIQDLATSNSFLPGLGSSTCTTTSTRTLATFLASGLLKQKYMSNGFKEMRAANSFPELAPYEELQMPVNSTGSLVSKEVKMVEGQNKVDWNVPVQNEIQLMGTSDPSLLWNTTNASVWLDPASIGSSVTSLI